MIRRTPSLHPVEHDHAAARVGLFYGLGAYLSWGIVPVYFKLLAHVPAMCVLVHRIVWSLVFLLILTAFRGGWHEIRSAVLVRGHLVPLLASTLLISVNWYTFIYAIETNRLLQASLGYFMNPLVSMLLGVVVMHERLRWAQMAGVVLAASGVALLTYSQQQVPWIAIILAISFGLYGLMRKVMHAGAIAGLTVETAILFVPSLLIILWMARTKPESIDLGRNTYLLLMLAGVITAIPLLFFAGAARRLRLSTLGFLQYIAPTSQLLLAVLLYAEPFTRWHAMSFALIWSALLIYSTDSYLAFRRRGSAPAALFHPAATQSRDDGAEPTA